MLISFPESNKKDIGKFKDLMNAKNLRYRENVAQKTWSLTVLLPSDASVIEDVSAEILQKIFIVSPNDIINYTPDGFSFKKKPGLK